MIKILPETLSNKIAAGEVVERPASVVKELVENALDAGSTRIIIEVEKGGRSLIRVSDNGAGMNHDDALLALERYATSKIHNETDLFSINTLGFRGEAVPSIASVSKFHLVTCEHNHDTGTSIFVDGGKIREVMQVGAPAGTMVAVKHLFFNTPARRKFLKTINTEMGHIAETAARIALSRPDVHFKLCHNTKTVKDWSKVSDPADRIVEVLGRDIKDDLCKIEYKENSFKVFGWISSPGISRSTSRGIYMYVNGRIVRDRIIQHALLEGFGGSLMKGRFPVAVLFIDIEHDRVDVNVHPAKSEVRFLDQKKVHDGVVKAVSSCLNMVNKPKWNTIKPAEVIGEYVSEPVLNYKKTDDKIPLHFEKTTQIDSRHTPPKQVTLWDKKDFAKLRIIGQLHNTYIVCESDNGFVLIDQHAAHERIIFEQLKKKKKASKNISQSLLIPETIELGYTEKEIFLKMIPELENLGLEIEPFGGSTFVVKSVPAILAERGIGPLISEIVEMTAKTGFGPGLTDAIEQCLMLMACHGSIRANQRLSDKEMQKLLDQLDECDSPSFCPHGRPTWINWSVSSIERMFKRII